MRTNILLVAFAAMVCVGCDISRFAQYRLSLPAVTGSERTVPDIQTVQNKLRAELATRGYVQWPDSSTGDRFWRKEQSTVSLVHTPTGDLEVFLDSFGPKSSFRESEHIEKRLLRVVAAYPNVKVTRVNAEHENTKRE
jgi:hypothetical protein